MGGCGDCKDAVAKVGDALGDAWRAVLHCFQQCRCCSCCSCGKGSGKAGADIGMVPAPEPAGPSSPIKSAPDPSKHAVLSAFGNEYPCNSAPRLIQMVMLWRETIRHELSVACTKALTTNVQIARWGDRAKDVNYASTLQYLMDLGHPRDEAAALLQYGGVVKANLTTPEAKEIESELKARKATAKQGGGFDLGGYARLKVAFAEGEELDPGDIFKTMAIRLANVKVAEPKESSRMGPDDATIIASVEDKDKLHLYLAEFDLGLQAELSSKIKIKLEGETWFVPELTATDQLLAIDDARLRVEFALDPPPELGFTIKLYVVRKPKLRWDLDIKLFFSGMNLPDWVEDTLLQNLATEILECMSVKDPLIMRFDKGKFKVIQVPNFDAGGAAKDAAKSTIKCGALSPKCVWQTAIFLPAVLAGVALDLFACKPCARSSSGQACSSALCSKSCCYRDPDKAAADFSGEVPTLQTSGKIEVDLGGTAVLGDFSLDPEDWK